MFSSRARMRTVGALMFCVAAVLLIAGSAIDEAGARARVNITIAAGDPDEFEERTSELQPHGIEKPGMCSDFSQAGRGCAQGEGVLSAAEPDRGLHQAKHTWIRPMVQLFISTVVFRLFVT